MQSTEIIAGSHLAFQFWKSVSFSKRAESMKLLSLNLLAGKDIFARIISGEMGKPVKESRAEIEKCAWLCEYYAENAEKMLERVHIKSDAVTSYVRFDPVGAIYAIMPWNYPFWQVFRAAVPTIMAGNTIVLKHAPNVISCAQAIEKLFLDSGFPNHVFSNLIIDVDLSEKVIANPLVQGVTLTGSQKAGSIVASQAGKYLKKCVLELGGSDPFIVLADADLNTACQSGIHSRMQNCGQVCISAKRFIVEERIFDQFVYKQKELISNLRLGDPMDESTDIGPMARPDLLDNIEKQVKDSIIMGAKVVCGGKRIENSFYAPTLLTKVKKGMPVYDQETFGPVSVAISVKNAEEALSLANDTSFGLGASIWSKNLVLAEKMASKIDAGAVFINGMTKSDPRLPFGGTKRSGFGRELGQIGIREFTNSKTVWIV